MNITEEIYSLMEAIHNDHSISGPRFNQLLRFGLVDVAD